MASIAFRLFSLSLAFSCFSSTGQAPHTPEQALKEKGVDTSLASLREALRDPRSDVRGLAASELAFKRDTASISGIRSGLSQTTTPQEHMNFAGALITLGDAQGKIAMQEVCDDNSVREDVRTIAAQLLEDYGGDGCTPSVIHILSTTTSESVRVSGLWYLRRGPAVSSLDMPELQHILDRALRDESFGNPLDVVSECILKYKLVDLAPGLERAAKAQTDEKVQKKMLANLQTLRASTP